LTEGRSRTDPDLIREAQAGSEAAVVALYERYLPSVWRYVHTRTLGDRHAAEDVVSETFLAAISRLPELSPDGGSFYAWLMSVARHKLGDHRRRNRRHGSRATAGLCETASDTDPDPGSALVSAEDRRQMAEAMTALPDDERLVLEWKYVEELSVRAIAGRLGRTEKAVAALLYRARNALRGMLRDTIGGQSP